MEKRNVMVKILGASGSGKTSISRIIEKALREANVDYEYKDQHYYQEMERESHKELICDEKLAELASEHFTVTLTEHQLARPK